MSCFSCLFGSKPESAAGQPSPPAPPAAFAAPAPAAAAPAPAPVAAAAAAEHNDASAKSTVEGKAGVTEVPAQRKDATPAVEQEAASRPPADAAAAAVAGSGPAWVTKAPTSEAGGGEASEGASFSVVGEVGLVGKGLNQAANFQPRATPRTVFGQGAQGGGSVDTNDVDLTGLQVGGSPSPDKGVSPSTPAPPRNVVAVNGAHALNGATAERLLPQAPPRNHRADGEGELTIVGGLHSSEAKAGPWVEEGDAAGEATVRDGDEACRPGAAVMVSARWTSVAYFQQFADQQGVLTRRGPHGGTWYACFPGSQEVAFSTGMHGQFVLAYSTLPSPPSPDPAAPNQGGAPRPAAEISAPMHGYQDLTPATTQSAQGQSGETMQAIEDSRSRNLLMRNQLQEQAAAENAAQQLQPKTKDATTDASVAVATDAPLAAPRGGKRSARSLSGPLSHRGAGRPASARSRAQMGAPPLGSARISVRSNYATPRVTTVVRGADVEYSDLDERPGRNGRFFKYPEWDEYELFDSDDLWSEHAYLLFGEPSGPGQTPCVYVWVGQYFEECNYMDPVECDKFAARATRDFQRLFARVPVGPIYVVKELEEDEDFWEYFVLG